MIHVLTIPSSIDRQNHIKKLMVELNVGEWRFVMGKETKLKFDGLFEAIKGVIREYYDHPYLIFMEDDILPTTEFSITVLNERIKEGLVKEADVVLGGIKQHCWNYRKEGNFIRVHNYRGSQLMVIYKKFYDRILAKRSTDGEFELFCSYDTKITKLVTFPFLAYQADFPSRFLNKDKHTIDYLTCEQGLK